MSEQPFSNKFRILLRLAKGALVVIPLVALAAVLHAHSPLRELYSESVGEGR
jgi:hypothetical protein